ncbi:MAG: hypothetical protein ACO23O_07820, partial [Ilumatobacteraceae bacterium]
TGVGGEGPGSLSAVKRLIAVAAIALTGCAGVTRADTVATFNDATLGQAEFDERYQAIAGEPFDGRVLGDTARDVVTDWIILQILDEGGFVDFYEAGPAESGIVCVSLIRTGTLEIAEDVVSRLEAGISWSDVLEFEYPQIQQNGDVECIPIQALGPLATQVEGLTLDTPYTVFQFEDLSSAVLRMRPAEQVPPLELAGLVQAVAPELTEGLDTIIETADISVDTRIGQFDPTAGGVVALG